MDQLLHHKEAEPRLGDVRPVVSLYDFDGVIGAPFEEALFTMNAQDEDHQFIRAVSEQYGLDLSNESFASARYICLQAVMFNENIPIQPGPMFDQIEGPFHILTARCDKFAVWRMHQFIDMHNLKPVKTMHLDHLAKGIMIRSIMDRHPDVRFRFYDDNLRHIRSARQLHDPRLEVFHVDNDMELLYVEAESFYRSRILKVVL